MTCYASSCYIQLTLMCVNHTNIHTNGLNIEIDDNTHAPKMLKLSFRPIIHRLYIPDI